MNHLTSTKILSALVALSVIFGYFAYHSYNTSVFGLLLVLAVLSIAGLITAIHDVTQTRHSLLRNYPLVGRLRWVFEHERSKIQQYFIEHDTNGKPYSREKRSDVYQKAKKQTNTTPFGTQLEVYDDGYEFLTHSMYPIKESLVEPLRINIGGSSCMKPYNASIFNISAMSYGSLSNAAIEALNGGAHLGNFFHNTGEGGISPYHLSGGDLCFQIGTGYFGAGKSIDGQRYFDDKQFIENANRHQVKLIEIKLSQGAKPGHGGILPAIKNTPEIAEIRGIEPGLDVMSPPFHSAFNDAESLVGFIEKLRLLSGGKPIGIKMCVGNTQELEDLIATMKRLDKMPDFITVDGGEGGTGAAPIVFTNSVGMPLVDALILVNQTLKNHGLRDKITVLASGKASNSFDIVRLLSLGADGVNAARAFMLSMGCIQARECHRGTCPVGIATQNKRLIKGLNPELKKVRVYNYHASLMREIKEVLAAMGVKRTKDLTPTSLFVRKNSKLENYG